MTQNMKNFIKNTSIRRKIKRGLDNLMEDVMKDYSWCTEEEFNEAVKYIISNK